MSCHVSKPTAFRFSGRLKMIQPMGPSFSTRRGASWLMCVLRVKRGRSSHACAYRRRVAGRTTKHKPARLPLARARKLQERLRDTLGKRGVPAFSAPAEIVPAVHGQERRPSRNQSSCLVQLGRRAERISRPVDEERGHAQVWKMGGAEILGTAGRMQRVGLEEQGAGQRGLGGEEHGGLAPAVGVAAEEETAADALAKDAERGAEPVAIAR